MCKSQFVVIVLFVLFTLLLTQCTWIDCVYVCVSMCVRCVESFKCHSWQCDGVIHSPAFIHIQVNFRPVATLLPGPGGVVGGGGGGGVGWAVRPHKALTYRNRAFDVDNLTPRRALWPLISERNGRSYLNLISFVLLPGQCNSRHSCTGLPRI